MSNPLSFSNLTQVKSDQVVYADYLVQTNRVNAGLQPFLHVTNEEGGPTAGFQTILQRAVVNTSFELQQQVLSNNPAILFPPTAPAQVTITAAGASYIIQWAGVPLAISYRVVLYESAFDTGPFFPRETISVQIPTTQYITQYSLQAGYFYYAGVVAVGRGGASAETASPVVSFISPPSPAEMITLTQVGRSLYSTWIDTSERATFFDCEIYRATIDPDTTINSTILTNLIQAGTNLTRSSFSTTVTIQGDQNYYFARILSRNYGSGVASLQSSATQFFQTPFIPGAVTIGPYLQTNSIFTTFTSSVFASSYTVTIYENATNSFNPLPGSPFDTITFQNPGISPITQLTTRQANLRDQFFYFATAQAFNFIRTGNIVSTTTGLRYTRFVPSSVTNAQMNEFSFSLPPTRMNLQWEPPLGITSSYVTNYTIRYYSTAAGVTQTPANPTIGQLIETKTNVPGGNLTDQSGSYSLPDRGYYYALIQTFNSNIAGRFASTATRQYFAVPSTPTITIAQNGLLLTGTFVNVQYATQYRAVFNRAFSSNDFTPNPIASNIIPVTGANSYTTSLTSTPPDPQDGAYYFITLYSINNTSQGFGVNSQLLQYSAIPGAPSVYLFLTPQFYVSFVEIGSTDSYEAKLFSNVNSTSNTSLTPIWQSTMLQHNAGYCNSIVPPISLLNGAYYYFAVTPFNRGQAGTEGNTGATQFFTAVGSPSTPVLRLLSTVSDNKFLRVNWGQPTDGSFPFVTDYRVTVYNNQLSPSPLITNLILQRSTIRGTTTFSMNTSNDILENQHYYWATVEAYNNTRISEAASTLTVFQYLAPTGTPIVIASNDFLNNNRASFSWATSIVGATPTGVSTIILYSNAAGSDTGILDQFESPYIPSFVTTRMATVFFDKYYYYASVRFFNLLVGSAIGTSRSLRYLAPVSAPNSVSTVLGTNLSNIRATWVSSFDGTASFGTGFDIRLWRSTPTNSNVVASNSILATGNTSNFLFDSTALDNLSTYFTEVRVRNATGDAEYEQVSPWKAASNALVYYQIPPRPTNVQVAVTAPSSILTTWNAPANYITSYSVDIFTNGAISNSTITGATTRVESLSNITATQVTSSTPTLTNANFYFSQVRAFNFEVSSFSTVSQQSVRYYTPPGPAASPTITVNSQGVTVASWSPNADGFTNSNSVSFYYNPNGTAANQLSTIIPGITILVESNANATSPFTMTVGAEVDLAWYFALITPFNNGAQGTTTTTQIASQYTKPAGQPIVSLTQDLTQPSTFLASWRVTQGNVSGWSTFFYNVASPNTILLQSSFPTSVSSFSTFLDLTDNARYSLQVVGYNVNTSTPTGSNTPTFFYYKPNAPFRVFTALDTSIGQTTFAVTNAGAGSYVINTSNNPTLTLRRGFVYIFNISASGHPFWIKTSQTTGTGDAYSSGVVNNGTDSGTITFTVPLDAPATLYYICQFHGSMVGILNIVDLDLTVGATGSNVNVFWYPPADYTSSFVSQYRLRLFSTSLTTPVGDVQVGAPFDLAVTKGSAFSLRSQQLDFANYPLVNLAYYYTTVQTVNCNVFDGTTSSISSTRFYGTPSTPQAFATALVGFSTLSTSWNAPTLGHPAISYAINVWFTTNGTSSVNSARYVSTIYTTQTNIEIDVSTNNVFYFATGQSLNTFRSSPSTITRNNAIFYIPPSPPSSALMFQSHSSLGVYYSTTNDYTSSFITHYVGRFYDMGPNNTSILPTNNRITITSSVAGVSFYSTLNASTFFTDKNYYTATVEAVNNTRSSARTLAYSNFQYLGIPREPSSVSILQQNLNLSTFYVNFSSATNFTSSFATNYIVYFWDNGYLKTTFVGGTPTLFESTNTPHTGLNTTTFAYITQSTPTDKHFYFATVQAINSTFQGAVSSVLSTSSSNLVPYFAQVNAPSSVQIFQEYSSLITTFSSAAGIASSYVTSYVSYLIDNGTSQIIPPAVAGGMARSSLVTNLARNFSTYFHSTFFTDKNYYINYTQAVNCNVSSIIVNQAMQLVQYLGLPREPSTASISLFDPINTPANSTFIVQFSTAQDFTSSFPTSYLIQWYTNGFLKTTFASGTPLPFESTILARVPGLNQTTSNVYVTQSTPTDKHYYFAVLTSLNSNETYAVSSVRSTLTTNLQPFFVTPGAPSSVSMLQQNSTLLVRFSSPTDGTSTFITSYIGRLYDIGNSGGAQPSPFPVTPFVSSVVFNVSTPNFSTSFFSTGTTNQFRDKQFYFAYLQSVNCNVSSGLTPAFIGIQYLGIPGQPSSALLSFDTPTASTFNVRFSTATDYTSSFPTSYQIQWYNNGLNRFTLAGGTPIPFESTIVERAGGINQTTSNIYITQSTPTDKHCYFAVLTSLNSTAQGTVSSVLSTLTNIIPYYVPPGLPSSITLFQTYSSIQVTLSSPQDGTSSFITSYITRLYDVGATNIYPPTIPTAGALSTQINNTFSPSLSTSFFSTPFQFRNQQFYLAYTQAVNCNISSAFVGAYNLIKFDAIPGNPVNVSTFLINSSINVSWSTPNDYTSSFGSQFLVNIYDNGTSATIQPGAVIIQSTFVNEVDSPTQRYYSSYLITNTNTVLFDKRFYFATVQTINNTVSSQNSTVSINLVPFYATASPPREVSSIVSGSNLFAYFSTATDSTSSIITEYNIRFYNNGANLTVPSNPNTATLISTIPFSIPLASRGFSTYMIPYTSPLSNASNYFVVVQAFNTVSNAFSSIYISSPQTAQYFIPPNSTTNIQYSIVGGNLITSWDPPRDNTSSFITAYRIELYNNQPNGATIPPIYPYTAGATLEPSQTLIVNSSMRTTVQTPGVQSNFYYTLVTPLNNTVSGFINRGNGAVQFIAQAWQVFGATPTRISKSAFTGPITTNPTFIASNTGFTTRGCITVSQDGNIILVPKVNQQFGNFFSFPSNFGNPREMTNAAGFIPSGNYQDVPITNDSYITYNTLEAGGSRWINCWRANAWDSIQMIGSNSGGYPTQGNGLFTTDGYYVQIEYDALVINGQKWNLINYVNPATNLRQWLSTPQLLASGGSNYEGASRIAIDSSRAIYGADGQSLYKISISGAPGNAVVTSVLSSYWNNNLYARAGSFRNEDAVILLAENIRTAFIHFTGNIKSSPANTWDFAHTSYFITYDMDTLAIKSVMSNWDTSSGPGTQNYRMYPFGDQFNVGGCKQAYDPASRQYYFTYIYQDFNDTTYINQHQAIFILRFDSTGNNITPQNPTYNNYRVSTFIQLSSFYNFNRVMTGTSLVLDSIGNLYTIVSRKDIGNLYSLLCMNSNGGVISSRFFSTSANANSQFGICIGKNNNIIAAPYGAAGIYSIA